MDFLSLFSALNRSGVRYVLVGGLAAVFHGVDRITADVDLAIDLAPACAADCIRALNDMTCPVLAVDLPSGLAADSGQPRLQSLDRHA